MPRHGQYWSSFVVRGIVVEIDESGPHKQKRIRRAAIRAVSKLLPAKTPDEMPPTDLNHHPQSARPTMPSPNHRTEGLAEAVAHVCGHDRGNHQRLMAGGQGLPCRSAPMPAVPIAIAHDAAER